MLEACRAIPFRPCAFHSLLLTIMLLPLLLTPLLAGDCVRARARTYVHPLKIYIVIATPVARLRYFTDRFFLLRDSRRLLRSRSLAVITRTLLFYRCDFSSCSVFRRERLRSTCCRRRGVQPSQVTIETSTKRFPRFLVDSSADSSASSLSLREHTALSRG